MRVFRARKTYHPGAKFSTWLFSIANNVANNALRSLARRRPGTRQRLRRLPDHSSRAPGRSAAVGGRARGLLKDVPESETGGVQVPVGAVFTPETEDTDTVWIIDEQTGVVRQQAVVTGQLMREGIQVLEGLKPGDWVAVAGVHTLREGQKVSIMEAAGD